MNNLRAEADAAVERAEVAEAKNKKYEQILLEKEQENVGLVRKVQMLEDQLDLAQEQAKESGER